MAALAKGFDTMVQKEQVNSNLHLYSVFLTSIPRYAQLSKTIKNDKKTKLSNINIHTVIT